MENEGLVNSYKNSPKSGTGFDDLQGGGGQGRDRAAQAKIEEGINVFRVMPAHLRDGENRRFRIEMSAVWLPAIVDERDADGKPTGAKKQSTRQFFNALKHGTKLGFDLVNEYAKYAESFIKANYKDEELTENLAIINGRYSDDKSKNLNGIKAKDNPFMYVVRIDPKTNKFNDHVQLLPLKTMGVVSKLRELQISEAAGQPINSDIYSDVDEGIPFMINYKPKDPTPANKYVVSLYQPKVAGKRELISFSLTETPEGEKLIDEFDAYPSLLELYGPDVFKRRDFDLQLEGLKIFDARYNFNFFNEDPKWMEMVDRFISIAEKVLGNGYQPKANEVVSNSTPVETKKVSSSVSDLPFEESEDDEEDEAPKVASPKSRWVK